MKKKRHILVIKHGALGDIVQGLDGFASLRAGHCYDHLSVLTTPAFKDFMAMMPFFDEVLIDKRGGVLNIAQHLKIRSLLLRGWDRIYDFQSSKRTIRYLDYLVPKGVEIVGGGIRASHPLPDMTGLNNRDRMLRTAELGGCAPRNASTDWLQASEISGITMGNQKPLAVLVAGSSPTKPEKRWPAAHYAALAKALIDAGFGVVLAGSRIDRAVGDAILSNAPDIIAPDIIDCIGKTSLAELASLLAKADVVIGNDTGPVFMAAKLGTPTLMLMSGATDPLMSAPVGKSVRWLREEIISSIKVADTLAVLRHLIDFPKK